MDVGHEIEPFERSHYHLVFKQTYSNYGALQLCVVAAVTRPFGRQFNFVNEKKDQSPA